jgi:hypothetical protein
MNSEPGGRKREKGTNLPRDYVIAHADLKRLTSWVRDFDSLAARRCSDQQALAAGLARLEDERRARLDLLADLATLRLRRVNTLPCPAFGLNSPDPPNGWSGGVPFVVKTDVKEGPTTGSSGEVRDDVESNAVVVNAMLVNQTGDPHWYSSWTFDADFPPSPFDGTIDYRTTLGAYMIWNETAQVWWLQLFATAADPVLAPSSLGDQSEGVCDMADFFSLGYPQIRSDPSLPYTADDHGVEDRGLTLSGRTQVEQGQILRLRMRVHLYGGVESGELNFGGSVAALAGQGSFGARYTFVPRAPHPGILPSVLSSA